MDAITTIQTALQGGVHGVVMAIVAVAGIGGLLALRALQNKKADRWN